MCTLLLHMPTLQSLHLCPVLLVAFRMGGAATGGVCGGLFDGDERFTVGGTFATMAVAANYTAGQEIEIVIQIWNNHVRRLKHNRTRSLNV